MQSDMLRNVNENTNKFWKDFGKVGVGSKANKHIHMEVISDNGSIIDEHRTVIDK